MRLDPEGSILRIRVTRQIPVSDSPLIDTLQALLRGPSPEEARQGLMTLIPEDARILSALVRDQTAYLNFNEEFQFNTYGMEGYVAQLRQVVWTATEFPTVADVQILIEGRRLDYLGESIRIGSPLSREGL
jgi:spore germination protein GerM